MNIRLHILKRKSVFFENYDQAEDSDLMIGQLKDLQNQIKKIENGCIMRMSAGSWFSCYYRGLAF